MPGIYNKQWILAYNNTDSDDNKVWEFSTAELVYLYQADISSQQTGKKWD